MSTVARHPLQEKYLTEIAPALKKQFELTNDLQVPKLKKIVISIGIGSKEPNKNKAFESVADQFMVISGQKPRQTIAKKSIAGFNMREGDPMGLMVTLRGERMWQFLDKLIQIVLPRFKDFQGISSKAFDANGNYNLGVQEQIVFPEIDYDKIDRIRGLQVTLVTSTKETEQAFALLEKLGLPFAKGTK